MIIFSLPFLSHGRPHHPCHCIPSSVATSISHGRPVFICLSRFCTTAISSSTISRQEHFERFFTVPDTTVVFVDPLNWKKPDISFFKPSKPLPQGNKTQVSLIISPDRHDRSVSGKSGDIQMYGCSTQTATNKTRKSNQVSLSASFKACLLDGDLVGARSVFDLMPGKGIVTWTCMMSAYAQHKKGMEALELFYLMHNEGTIVPDTYSYACALNACTIVSTLEDGRIIHSAIVSNSSANLYMVVETALIGLYGKCGSINDAICVFQGLSYRDTVCWNTMIAVLVQYDHDAEAFVLFRRMYLEGIQPNSMSYMHILHACADARNLRAGLAIHTAILGAGCEHHKVLNTTLINMYTRCGSISLAVQVFHSLSHHDNISWTMMIAAFSRHGHFSSALLCFYQMQSECIRPDNITFICTVDACAGLRAGKDGLQLHAAIVESEHAGDVMLLNALLNMYIKCGYIHDAWRAFDSLCSHDDLSWNTMLEALSDYGYHKESMCFFLQVLQRDQKPNASSYACVINACTKLLAFEQGKMLHAGIVESGDDDHLVIVSALINMYGKNGRPQDAKKVFETAFPHDVVCCNAMMKTLVQTGDLRDALNLFYKMEQMCLKLSTISFLCALDACNGLISLKDGQKIHCVIAKRGRMHDIMVASALINMYGKCGSLPGANKIFEDVPCKDLICWTSMIVALTENQLHEEALNAFSDMVCNGINPDAITYVCILNACACMTVMEVVFIIHAAVVEMKFEENTLIGTGIMNVYGKGGTVEDASRVFSGLSFCDVGTWNAMLGVYAHNGNEYEIKELFKQFEMNMFKPSPTTFISILVAFGHAGKVDDGWYFLHYMRNKYGLIPEIEHYICMVDLLGRAGQLNEAESLIGCMPFQRASIVCRCMFSACIMHGNLEYGEYIARFCFELNGHSDSAYVMLSNMYAILGSENDELSLISIIEETHGHELILYT